MRIQLSTYFTSGGVTKERGLEVAAKAIKKLPSEDIRFHVIGPCRDENLAELLASDNRIVSHGKLDWMELGQHYEHSHIGLALYQPLPCFTYYTGENAVKIIEYMAAGMPVITSNFKGLSKFINELEIGLVVDPTDPTSVAEAINSLCVNKELREKIAHNARSRFESEFNWEHHQQRLIELYQRVLLK